MKKKMILIQTREVLASLQWHLNVLSVILPPALSKHLPRHVRRKEKKKNHTFKLGTTFQKKKVGN